MRTMSSMRVDTTHHKREDNSSSYKRRIRRDFNNNYEKEVYDKYNHKDRAFYNGLYNEAKNENGKRAYPSEDFQPQSAKTEDEKENQQELLNKTDNSEKDNSKENKKGNSQLDKVLLMDVTPKKKKERIKRTINNSNSEHNKRISCGLCEYRCAYPYLLRVHQRTCHNVYSPGADSNHLSSHSTSRPVGAKRNISTREVGVQTNYVQFENFNSTGQPVNINLNIRLIKNGKEETINKEQPIDLFINSDEERLLE